MLACGNGRDVQMTEHIRCDDTGTSAVLCPQLISTQRGDTGACSLGSLFAFCERALRFLCL